MLAISTTTPQSNMVQEGLACAEKALAQSPNDESLRITYAGLLRLSNDRKRFVPYLNQLMQDVGEHSVAVRMLFLNALLDEGSLDAVERQIKELSEFDVFDRLLDGVKKRLKEQRESGTK